MTGSEFFRGLFSLQVLVLAGMNSRRLSIAGLRMKSPRYLIPLHKDA